MHLGAPTGPFTALAFSVALLSVAAVGAQPKAGGHSKGPHVPGGPLLNQPDQRLADGLDLSEVQRAKVSEIRARFRAEIESDAEAARRIRSELRALWSSGDVPARDAVQALQSKMHAHRMAMADASIDARIAILKVLTPEQRKRVAELKGDRRGRPETGGKDGKQRGSDSE